MQKRYILAVAIAIFFSTLQFTVSLEWGLVRQMVNVVNFV